MSAPVGHYFFYALHGFLGQSSDWSKVFDHSSFKKDTVAIPDFFSDPKYSSLSTATFVQDISNLQKQNDFLKKIFVGYSLGGRIGLRILESQPNLFDHYVFISTHPGLTSPSERDQRLQSDQVWVDRLHALNWEEFVEKWNAQGVFDQSVVPPRRAQDFQKSQLEQGLTAMSLGSQKDYSNLIQEHQDKITWVVGKKDQKFLSIAEDLEQKKILLKIKRIFSSHRILIDAPKELQELLLSQKH